MIFKDLVENTLKDGRLKFADKQKPWLAEETDPKVDEDLFVEHVDVLLVDITDGIIEVEPRYKEQMKVVFPKAEEEFIDFLNLWNLKDSKVMLCLC